MAFQVLDVSGAQSATTFFQLTQLEGVEYLLNFTWNSRETAWYLGIYDQDQNPLCLQIKLVVSWSLLRKFRQLPNIPPGCLYCADLTNAGLDVQTPTELGVRVPLYYVTSDDARLAGLVF